MEKIYKDLEEIGIKVIDTSQLIDVQKEEPEKELKFGIKMDEFPDSVQTYLKEIGRTELRLLKRKKNSQKN